MWKARAKGFEELDRAQAAAIFHTKLSPIVKAGELEGRAVADFSGNPSQWWPLTSCKAVAELHVPPRFSLAHMM